MNIGEKILEIMEQEKVSQTELASSLGMSRQSLHQYLTRKPENIRFDIVWKALDKMGYSIKIEKKPE